MMFPLLPASALLIEQRQEHDRRIAAAWRRACELQRVPAKVAEDALSIDHGQAQRQYAGVERSQLLTRAVHAAEEHDQVALFGQFLACLADEFGGWEQVMAHGAGQITARAWHLFAASTDASGAVLVEALKREVIRTIRRVLRLLVATPGRARMLRASLTSTPRSQESVRCANGSWQVSA